LTGKTVRRVIDKELYVDPIYILTSNILAVMLKETPPRVNGPEIYYLLS
jgi:hypothetical protein